MSNNQYSIRPNELSNAICKRNWVVADRILQTEKGRDFAKQYAIYGSHGSNYGLHYCMSNLVWSSGYFITAGPASFLVNLVKAHPGALSQEFRYGAIHKYPLKVALSELNNDFPIEVVFAMIDQYPNPGKNADDDSIIAHALNMHVEDGIISRLLGKVFGKFDEKVIDLLLSKERSDSVTFSLLEGPCLKES